MPRLIRPAAQLLRALGVRRPWRRAARFVTRRQDLKIVRLSDDARRNP